MKKIITTLKLINMYVHRVYNLVRRGGGFAEPEKNYLSQKIDRLWTLIFKNLYIDIDINLNVFTSNNPFKRSVKMLAVKRNLITVSKNLCVHVKTGKKSNSSLTEEKSRFK